PYRTPRPVPSRRPRGRRGDRGPHRRNAGRQHHHRRRDRRRAQRPGASDRGWADRELSLQGGRILQRRRRARARGRSRTPHPSCPSGDSACRRTRRTSILRPRPRRSRSRAPHCAGGGRGDTRKL
ncbi:MAG: hypothetical protein AVDCRST_MAG90-2137, partial [uncultured Microvirga sp.]